MQLKIPTDFLVKSDRQNPNTYLRMKAHWIDEIVLGTAKVRRLTPSVLRLTIKTVIKMSSS